MAETKVKEDPLISLVLNLMLQLLKNRAAYIRQVAGIADFFAAGDCEECKDGKVGAIKSLFLVSFYI